MSYKSVMKRLFRPFLSALFTLCILSTALHAKSETIPATGEVFRINGSQGQLACKLLLPQMNEGEKCPVVIFSHGFGGNMESRLWELIISRLNEAGIGAFKFDFNGHGQSEGLFQNMTVPNENMDLLSVISYVRTLPITKNISLLGHSQGGVVTSMVSGDCGAEQIECEVLLAAAAVLREDALKGTTMGAKFDPWHLDAPYVTLPHGDKLGREYIQTAMSLPIYETAEKYTGPALVINGMADQIVPYTYGELYHKVLKNSDIILIPGENHGFTVSTEYVADLVCDWLTKHLRN